MNSTKLTPQQLGDLKREFANLMVGDMTPKELFEFAIHRVTCDVATMKQDELKEHISEYDEFAYEILEDYVTDIELYLTEVGDGDPELQLTQQEEYVLNQRCLGRWKAKNEDDLREKIFDFSGFPVETIDYIIK